MTQDSSTDLAERIDAIESAYEFMLAYAAQGREGDEGGSAEEIRGFLTRLDAALEDLGTAISVTFQHRGADPGQAAPFVEIAGQDARRARAAVALVLSRKRISSQLVDNLNASTHVRALLTDLFLLDESLKIEG